MNINANNQINMNNQHNQQNHYNPRNIANMDLRRIPCTVIKASEREGHEEQLEEREFGDIQSAIMWARENADSQHQHPAWHLWPAHHVERDLVRNIRREGWDWGLVVLSNDDLEFSYTLYLDPERIPANADIFLPNQNNHNNHNNQN